MPVRVVLRLINGSGALKLDQDVLRGIADLTAAAWASVSLAYRTNRCVKRPRLVLPIGVPQDSLPNWPG